MVEGYISAERASQRLVLTFNILVAELLTQLAMNVLIYKEVYSARWPK